MNEIRKHMGPLLSDEDLGNDVPTDGWYICEDCDIIEHIGKLTSGCPECGQTMVPYPWRDKSAE
jgi:hypothetical protein